MTDALDTTAAGRPLPAAPRARWQLRLLGDLVLAEGSQAGPRLPSRAAAALLARLAMAPQRAHAREELIELLWPGVALDVGRNRLRQVLSTLKSLLEPPGAAGAPVLQADRQTLRLTPDALHCDVPAFEAALRAGRLDEARALYQGELMPGFFDEWIAEERLRLAALADRLHERLARRGPEPAEAPGAIGEPSLPAHPPAPAPAAPALPAAGIASLPRYLTPLHGADAVGARLRAELQQHRLVTVLGPGGHGKTRLAVEVARILAGDSRLPEWLPPGRPGQDGAAAGSGFDYIAFVPLVGCTSREAMLDAMLLALQQEGRAGEPLARLGTLLAGRRALLVLDNAEQLAEAAAPVVAALLEVHEGLRLLVTSRRVLGVDGEREFVLPPLPLPGPDSNEAEAAMNPAVALFVDRARAARADFHLSSRNRAAVVALVRRLEGMPLAIELAASRVRSLPPALLLEQLETARNGPQLDALVLLARSGTRGGHDPRHASMLAVLQWSWQLLSTEAQALLCRLSVFAGGFTLAAAQAVCGEPDEPPVALALDELVAQSMLRALGESGRFELFELVRLFAAAMLPADEAPRRRARHRAWVARWAGALPLDAPLPALREELPNLAAALASARTDAAPADAAALAAALGGPLIDLALPPGALRALAESAALMAGAEARALSRAYLARALFRAGEPDAARVQADQARAELPAGGLARAQVLARLAHVRWRVQREPEADAWLAEAQALAEADPAGSTPQTLALLASILATRGAIARPRDAAAAIALQRRSLALWIRAGDVHGMNTGRVNLAIALADTRAGCDEALALLDEALAGTRRQGDWLQAGQAANARGEALCRLRRWAEAAEAYRDCVRIAQALPDPLLLTYGLWNLPRALAHLRQPVEATRLMACAEGLARLHWGRLSRADQRDLRRLARLCAGQAAPAALATARQQGAGWTLAEAAAAALVR